MRELRLGSMTLMRSSDNRHSAQSNHDSIVFCHLPAGLSDDRSAIGQALQLPCGSSAICSALLKHPTAGLQAVQSPQLASLVLEYLFGEAVRMPFCGQLLALSVATAHGLTACM